MATVTSFEAMAHPGRHELKQFAELFEPVFKASSPEARRNAVAALARCPVVPQSVAWFIACQPLPIAAIFHTRSPAIDDDTLIAVARTQGSGHARAIAARANLSVKVVDALVALHQGHDSDFRIANPDYKDWPARPDRAEAVRQDLKTMVLRDTLAREAESEEAVEETRHALLVRFARLREIRRFSLALAELLGASHWLSDRILLDLSGVQLASALVAMGTEPADGIFVLTQVYPHLAQEAGSASRAAAIWASIDETEAEDRVAAWIRADNLTQGVKDEPALPANHNPEPDGRIAIGDRPAYAHARGSRLR